ncbi:MAG: hypothetical protein K0S44_1081 [Bacteroidetes bacterium]|jgi:uncharacterized protein (DUF1697 family)|nr:hypothetical protein [Bacteroidota bacterium]
MPELLAMLRGINVSGQKKVPMADLKAVFDELKYKNAQTYIQSGNVIFDGSGKPEAHSKKISKKIKDTFGFEVPVVVLEKKELEAAVKKNPFLKEKGVDVERLYLTFLEKEAEKEYLDKIKLPDKTADRFVISGKVVYLYCPGGYGETKLNNNFFENKLKVTATTRNWRTCNVLLEMMNRKNK